MEGLVEDISTPETSVRPDPFHSIGHPSHDSVHVQICRVCPLREAHPAFRMKQRRKHKRQEEKKSRESKNNKEQFFEWKSMKKNECASSLSSRTHPFAHCMGDWVGKINSCRETSLSSANNLIVTNNSYNDLMNHSSVRNAFAAIAKKMLNAQSLFRCRTCRCRDCRMKWWCGNCRCRDSRTKWCGNCRSCGRGFRPNCPPNCSFSCLSRFWSWSREHRGPGSDLYRVKAWSADHARLKPRLRREGKSVRVATYRKAKGGFDESKGMTA